MSDSFKSSVTSKTHWLRLFYMVLFACALYLAILLTWFLVAAQFLLTLLTGSDNLSLRGFCDTFSTYIYQILRYLTYNTDEKPFPFNDWPEPRENAGAAEPGHTHGNETSSLAERVAKPAQRDADGKDPEPGA